MNRRQFFKRSAAGAIAATVVEKGEALAATPVLYGDGEHDDTVALIHWRNGRPVNWDNGKPVPRVIRQRLFLVNTAFTVDDDCRDRLFLCGFKMKENYDTSRFIRAAGKIGR